MRRILTTGNLSLKNMYETDYVHNTNYTILMIFVGTKYHKDKIVSTVLSLEASVQRYFNASLAPSTQKTHHCGIMSFLKFCSNLAHIHSQLPKISSAHSWLI